MARWMELLDGSGFSKSLSEGGRMRIFLTIFVILISTYIVNASLLDPVIENVVHLKANKPPNDVPGIWKKKTIWKPRWIKEWKSAKVMKPVWRKVWGPVQIREWLPFPKPPPGWDAVSTLLNTAQQQKNAAGDSQAHNSFAVSSSVPLWDPVPYPESQQPPPPPPPQPQHQQHQHHADSSASQTFNHQMISEIIGPRYSTPENQNLDYSETVNHMTRLPPDNWKPPQQFDNRFNNFALLPEFLVPPKFMSLPVNDARVSTPPPPVQVSPSLGFELPKNLPPWTPLPPTNKNQFATKPPPIPTKNNTIEEKSLPRGNNEYIQEAQLVGEYHYSEFDLPNKQVSEKVPEKEDTKPVQEKTKPVVQNPKPVLEKPKPNPFVERPQPKVEQPKPIVEQPRPSLEQPKPVVQKPKELQQQKNQQKKHIADIQEATIQEIFPIYRRPLNLTRVFSFDQQSSTQLFPVTPTNTAKQQTESPPPKFIPLPNNKPFLPNLNPTPTVPNNRSQHQPQIQLVFATTPEDQVTTEKTTTTTEPYEIIFSSSLMSTTERTTESGVIVVTPAKSGES